MTSLQQLVIDAALKRLASESPGSEHHEPITDNMPTDKEIKENGFEGAVDIIVQDTIAAIQ